MKRVALLLIALLPYLSQAQSPVKKKKYPSLLWEITGNGLKKPSYLFGTMHVSSKMAFHLADSFYLGIHNADMVALETNPESWQEDMSKYVFGNKYDNYKDNYLFNNFISEPEEYLSQSTLKFYKYDKKIERTLYSNPSTINNLLYRSYGNESSDFEEDTYLDMYIYQCGKKWGKKVAGVEKYAESMKLMAEAYKDAEKDKNKKERSYDNEDDFSSGNLQEAYRTGNLDWLDSINRYNSFSTAFDEKFLYRRNEIQAGSIDSILKTGQSLFVGVGAAHLPGNRGVIELLRSKGYKVRPVKMGERDSQHKSQVEKLKVPVVFSTQAADDGIYKVDIPGKFYKQGDDASLEQRQYADMANGSYYMVTRIMTNSWMWGHTTQKVQQVVDSLLYENIPGKIITKTAIVKNGYPGVDITNKTRRGDIQRYNIFVTPFEIIVFKMGGTGEYVQTGDEAKRFFGSIRLKEFNAVNAPAAWKKYSPSYGGFAINFPHEPYIGNDGSWIFDTEDKSTHTQYRVVRTDIHNHHFTEEDTFDLNLLNESFASSEFIDKEISHKQTTYKGYPALDVQYRDKSGDLYLARFIIQGPHYYTLVAHGKQETTQMKDFLNSFEIKPYIYKEAKERKDTSLYYTVKSPVFPEPDKDKLEITPSRFSSGDDDEDNESNALTTGVFRSRTISNDTTGEKIFVSFYKMNRYYYYKDSARLDREDRQPNIFGDSTWIVRSKKKYTLPNKTRVWEVVATDTGSSRTIRTKSFFKDGIGYLLTTESDTLSQPSDFVKTFYDSFSPVDTIKGMNPFQKKTSLVVADFMSTDSIVHQRAVKGMYMVKFEAADLASLKQLINGLSWKEKKYLDTKKMLIAKLDNIETKDATDFLKQMYYAAGDTVELQYAVLESLLQQETKYSYTTFRDIMISEPPVLEGNAGSTGWTMYPVLSAFNQSGEREESNNGGFMDELYRADSLELMQSILPDLLTLMNLDDYKWPVMNVLSRLVDSNMAKPKDYETYFNKFQLEAKQELKKQAIAEKKKAIEKAESAKEDKKSTYVLPYEQADRDDGNESLATYATLLLPFWDSKPTVQPLIGQMLASSDKQLKYSTLFLLLRNNKPYPDSLLKYFAGMDEYRYELYNDLKKMDKKEKFPAQYNNPVDLGKSKLLGKKSYDKPDSLVYLDKFPAEIKDKKGFIYFFKYKNKKDDASWKLATVGLVPATGGFEFDEPEEFNGDFSYLYETPEQSYDFTAFSETKIDEELVLTDQLKKELKKILYSRHKSAKQFYGRDYTESSDLLHID